MSALLIPALALFAGFVVLSLSADRLIASAATLARHFNVSLVFIGMTVVAFGTSAPELLVSAVAALNGAEGLSVGNGIGSNIINVGLVLGACALMTPLMVHRRFVRREFPILVAAMILCAVLMANGELAGWDGAVLLLGLMVYVGYLARSVKNGDAEPEELEFLSISKGRALVESLLMLALLLASSQLMVWGAVELARAAGISELVIGLTVIAFGTSLPELAAALAGVRRGMHDIAFATVIGSNIFNLLGVIAFPALLGDGLQLPAEVIQRDLPAMGLLTAAMGAMFLMANTPSAESSGGNNLVLHRRGGVVLLILFVAYLWQLGTAMAV
ncbi:calcium/sodium antiporter [Ferrimonas marina]|uniref:Cation:H+ antiporter n=1 Tax=Ferrimonas marina TaxID=299255 RepID=A0A1M5VPX5_9GAMM|nr:calcium/sodium antiporter [Ferrimonas marina]SHH77292.1 cation:H+ antiporter [Ferrimonas marina]